MLTKKKGLKLSKLSSNKKLLFLSILLISLIVGIYVVNNYVGIFNLNKSASGRSAPTMCISDFDGCTHSSECCSNKCLIGPEGEPQCLPSSYNVTCRGENKACGQYQQCCTGLTCRNNYCKKSLVSERCDARNQPSTCDNNTTLLKCVEGRWQSTDCSKSGKTCSSSGTRAECVDRLSLFSCLYSCDSVQDCSDGAGKKVSGICSGGKVCCKYSNLEPRSTDDPTSGCNFDCVSRTQCNTYGQEKGGTCSGGKVCCDL